MADSPEKTDKTSDASAEKAYAEAAAQVKAGAKLAAAKKAAPSRVAPKKAAPKKVAPKKAPATKAPTVEAAAKPAPAKKAPVKKAPVKKVAVKEPATASKEIEVAAAVVEKTAEVVEKTAEVVEKTAEVAAEVVEKTAEATAEVVEKVANPASPAVKKPAAKAKAPPAPKKAPARKKPAAKPTAPKFTTAPTITELKEMIMATKTTDLADKMTKSMSDAVSEMQTRAQAAYDKSTGFVSEMAELAKGNAEAFVESGKIFSGGVQDLGKTFADEAKSAYEVATADMKDMAAIKSPTELFQLQGKIMRRNFDSLVATSSKNSEAAMKLMNDTFAPISARVNTSVETFSKVA